MTFTDENLKRLKEDVAMFKGLPCGCDLNREVFQALLARLEAAEKAVVIAREVQQGINGVSWKYFYSAWQAWREVAGKD